MKKILNRYNIQGRLLPTILCVIPFLLFQYLVLDTNQINFLTNFGNIKILGDFTISIAIIYFLMQINRFFGKHIFEKNYFKNQFYFPTTTWLLLSDKTLSTDFKQNIRDKIEADFKISLFNANQEKDNEYDARKTIRDAVGLIRRKVGDGVLTLQHNVEYGFFRNLIGGSLISIIMSVIILIISFNKNDILLFGLSILLVVTYLILLLLSKKILTKKGSLYTEILFQEFMTE